MEPVLGTRSTREVAGCCPMAKPPTRTNNKQTRILSHYRIRWVDRALRNEPNSLRLRGLRRLASSRQQSGLPAFASCACHFTKQSQSPQFVGLEIIQLYKIGEARTGGAFPIRV